MSEKVEVGKKKSRKRQTHEKRHEMRKREPVTDGRTRTSQNLAIEGTA